MKKLLLLVIGIGLSTCCWAQQYELNLTAHLRFNGDNNIRCSHFRITFTTSKGNTWEWYQAVSGGYKKWLEYSRTFSCAEDEKVVSMSIYAMRKYESGFSNDCKQGGSGTRNFAVSDRVYICDGQDGLYRDAFGGFSAESYLEFKAKPLSNVHAIQTETLIKTNKSQVFLLYEISAVYNDNTTEVISFYDRGFDKNEQIVFQDCILKANSQKKIKEITVTHTYLDGWRFKSDTYTYTPSGDFPVEFDEPFYAFGGKIRIRYGKVDTPVRYGPDNSKILPSNNPITLTVPGGYGKFQWQFQAEGQSWQNVPATLGEKSSIKFSGAMLFGASVKNYWFKSIRFRAVYKCHPDRITEVISLSHLPSAPGIVSVTPVNETCYGANDAKLIVKFDRPLYQGTINGTPYRERLRITLDERISDKYPGHLDSDNSVTETQLSPGSHELSLLSTFEGVGAGYSDGDNHKRSITIPAQTAVTNFQVTKSDVHCYGGEDGIITVSAQGGTENYISYLSQNGVNVGQISLTQNTGNSFTELKPGTYTVRLKDSNGCDPKDGSGSIIVLDRTIEQPGKKLVLSTVENVEPRGYGLTDGHVTVRSEHGTMPYTFEWTEGGGTTREADPPVTEGSSMTSTLSNIGKGIYHVRSEDANYALAYPRTEVNLSGCFDELTIEVTEPPLLEVALAEHHYVSCYGYSDGAVVAHAKGGRPYLSGHAYEPYQYEWFLINPSAEPFGESDSIAIDRHSALYRVKVTDRNGIVAWSPDFMLIQPDPLKINFNTSELLCNGDTNGTSEALPYGGTTPYAYSWSTDAKTQSVSNLGEGFYSVVVKDYRGCTTFAQTEVKVPNSLEVTPDIIPPTCYNYTDGSIRLHTTGGRLPYTYAWSQGTQTDFAQGLGHGRYEVNITDANGCYIEREFTLDNPALLPVALGADKVLCIGQVLEINGAIEDPAAQYLWTKDNTPFATTATATLSDPGAYTLQVTDSKGCLNTDAISITRDETEIAADFVVATRVPRGEPVRLANISHPAPDAVAWIIPSGVQVVAENPAYIELIFTEYDEYTIGLRSMKNACERTEYKTLRAVSKRELTDYEAPDEPYIKQFMVSPNPNEGTFTVAVELREAADFKLILYSGQGTVITSTDVKGQSVANINFDVSTSVSSGIYMLQLITTQGLSTFKVMIK